MKKIMLFLGIVLCYFLLTYLDKNYITTNSKVFDFLAKDYPSEAVKSYMDSQAKWWWLAYALTPLLVGIKVLLVTFCLNFIKLFDLPGLEKIQYQDLLELVLVTEFIFIIAGLYKFVNFYWFDPNYNLKDLQTYYPLSLLNFQESISTEKWLAYPLQLCNIFEFFYWGVLAYGIWEYADQKISFPKALGMVVVTYGTGLLFWVGTVTFLILNAQY